MKRRRFTKMFKAAAVKRLARVSLDTGVGKSTLSMWRTNPRVTTPNGHVAPVTIAHPSLKDRLQAEMVLIRTQADERIAKLEAAIGALG